MKEKEYALYKDDEFICRGTIEEISKHEYYKIGIMRFCGYREREFGTREKEYDLKEAAKLLGIAHRTIHSYLQLGTLKAKPKEGFGRTLFVKESEIERFKNERLAKISGDSAVIFDSHLKRDIQAVAKKLGETEKEFIEKAIKERIAKYE